MNIRILQLLEGAARARGMTVIIDVFRAYSLEAFLLHRGAEKIIPLADAEQAYRLKEAHPEMLLAGERGGAVLPGFDFGNSPSQAQSVSVSGKTVIHTTSAGTQGIAAAVHAEEILGGSLVTARAIASYIRQKNPAEVSLVCMGLAAKFPTEEDTLCAEYIKSLLEGTSIDMAKKIESLRHTSGAKFFDPAQSSVFPEADFHMCVQTDLFPFVVRYEKSPDGLPCMRKVNV